MSAAAAVPSPGRALLESAPQDWAVSRLGREGYFVAGTGFPHAHQGRADGTIPFFKVSDMSSDGNTRTLSGAANTVSDEQLRELRGRLCPPGGIAFAKVGAALLLNRRRLIEDRCLFDNNMMAYVPRCQHPPFVWYWLQLIDLGHLSNPGPVPSVNEGTLRDVAIPVPPLETQRAIAAFLDQKTAAIDALIAKKERLIKLLQEKRQALITEAVTKGLNPNVPMKDSGIEWLGEIPAHWEVRRLTQVLNIENQKRTPISRAERAEMQGEYPYWGPTGVLDRINVYQYSGEYALIGEDGDHFNKFATWPMTQWVTGRFNVNNHAHVISSGRLCSVRWFYYSFLHRDIGGDLIAQGVSRLKLTKARLASLPIPVPPPREQADVIVFIEAWIEGSAATVCRIEEQIRLLREYRQALITAAVTGKLDVTKEQAA